MLTEPPQTLAELIKELMEEMQQPKPFNLQVGLDCCALISCLPYSNEVILRTARLHDDWLPSPRTFYRWLLEPGPEGAKLATAYAEAKDLQSDLLASRTIDIADCVDALPPGMIRDVTRDALRIKASQWMAAKLAPKKYGEARVVELKGGLDNGNRDVRELPEDELLRIAASDVVEGDTSSGGAGDPRAA